MTMELSMTIALVAALAIREYFAALIILVFVPIAEMLEELTVEPGKPRHPNSAGRYAEACHSAP